MELLHGCMIPHYCKVEWWAKNLAPPRRVQRVEEGMHYRQPGRRGSTEARQAPPMNSFQTTSRKDINAFGFKTTTFNLANTCMIQNPESIQNQIGLNVSLVDSQTDGVERIESRSRTTTWTRELSCCARTKWQPWRRGRRRRSVGTARGRSQSTWRTGSILVSVQTSNLKHSTW